MSSRSLRVALALLVLSSFALADDEPPRNPFLARSSWPMTHRDNYRQGSSPLPGPEDPSAIEIRNLQGDRTPPLQLYSGKYPDGKSVVWNCSLTHISKIDPESWTYLDQLEKKPIRDMDRNVTADQIFAYAGAYSFLDCNNDFYTPYVTSIRVYSDAVRGRRDSRIVLRRSVDITRLVSLDSGDSIIALGLSWDGRIVYLTVHGVLGILTREFTEHQSVRLPSSEQIYNAFAMDERGGIYVVTDVAMHRVQWTGTRLSRAAKDGAWSAPYGDSEGSGNTFAGSGSTPTLMGTRATDDRFVAITDGSKPNVNVLLFWRDRIPADWTGLPGLDRRIAARAEVRFDEGGSANEQSLLVRGYGVVVVNNKYGIEPKGTLGKAAVALVDNAPRLVAPYGISKFEWDPKARHLCLRWTSDESCPNGVPTMSAASNLAYFYAQRNGVWGLLALDWTSGEEGDRDFFFPIPGGRSPEYNSYFSAAQVGESRDLLSGTLLGSIGFIDRGK